MHKFKLAALVALSSVALSGCATVINGTSQDYKIKTDPSGATVKFTNGSTCVSPCEMSLKRRHDTRADITREGYKPVYVLVQSKTGGAAAGNILLGGLIGGVVDGSNGATNFLSPTPLSVKLVPLGATGEPQLLDKKGKVISTVQAHNDKVRDDVAKTIGVEAAGKVEPAKAVQGADPAAVSAPAAESSPSPAPAPQPVTGGA